MSDGKLAARAAVAAVCLCAVWAMTACVPGAGRQQPDPEWAYDEPSGRYYMPDVVSQSTALVDEHLPDLGPDSVESVTVTEGRFRDPDGREVFPGPDDYWWQAVLVLEEEAVSDLVEGLPGAGTGAGGSGPARLTDLEVEEALVPTTETQAGTCSDGWIDVTNTATNGGRTAAGDGTDLVAVCPTTRVFAFSAFDM
ncbi:hypothetical protein [Brevibacterium litoralis]|uniref:hypothetical protein n=1 Tax=Brevibacterium litoralis TaxID=3138935 RepID=UPI0032EDD2FB